MRKLVYLFLCALLCMAFCGCSNEKAANALKDAIYLDKPIINPANEGKLVIIHGIAKMSKKAQDTELNLVFDSPVVTRTVEALEKHTETTTNTKTTTSSDGQKVESKETKQIVKYDWKEINVKGANNKFKTETFIGEAKIGDFTITGNPLKHMFNNKKITVSRDMATKSGLYYWKQGLSKSFLTTRRVSDRFMTPDSELKAINEGISRISYEGRDKEAKGEYTFAGIQQNGKLVSTKEFTIQYYSGNLTKEQMIETNK